MANKFKVISQQFLNQYRNYDFSISDWTLNLTEFTTRLQGNVGEKLQMTEVIEIGTIVNEDQAIEMEYRLTDEVLRAPLLDFQEEGLYNGAALSIDLLGTTITGTVENITGSSNQDLVLSSATITALTGAGLVDGDVQTDIVIKVTTAPEYLLYKYGINPNDLTAPRYQSPLDEGEQSYQYQGIPMPSAVATMEWTGNEIGSSLGTVTIEFDATRELYKHQYTLIHEFIIPFYTEGQLSNLQDQTNPKELLRNNSLKYSNGFWFGGARNETTLVYQDLGKIGNVGYFGENFNGFDGAYAVTDYAVSNASNTGKIEVTEVNTVTFTITADTPTGFVGGEEIILYHSKLPSSEEYGNSKTSYDTNWITSQVRQTEAAGAVGSGVFTNVTVTLSGSDLDVSADVTYTSDEQDLLTSDSLLDLYFTVATRDLTDPDIMDRVNVTVQSGQPSKDTQVTGLITNWQPNIYKNAEFDGGVQYTDFDGWDGDLNGQDWTFRTDVTQGALISKVIFRVVADNGTSYFPLYVQSIPIPSVQGVIVTGDQFQILDINSQGTLNLPSGLLLNRVKLNADVPVSSLGYQTWTGSIAFRVPWKEWIANSAVPPTFVDYNEPNNNLNTKSSNYSGVSSYEIKTVLSVVVQNDTGVDTEYDLLSDASVISDFDITGTTFTAVTKYYDANNDLVTNLFTNADTRVEVEFTHALGVIAVGDITGRVWIEPENNIGEPIGELSTDLDFTSFSNALTPTDTLVTGNVSLVEVVSVSNLVTFIYEVNKDKITDGVNYNVYARIDSI